MYKILLQQFIKQFGRVPSALEKILLKQKATKQALDQRKVLDMKGNPLNPNKPIIGGTQEFKSGIIRATGSRPTAVKTEAQIKSKLEGMNKKTIERIKRRRYEAAQKAEREKMAKDPNYLPDIIDPDDFLAGGGLAGMLGEPTYVDDNHRVPYKDAGFTGSPVYFQDKFNDFDIWSRYIAMSPKEGLDQVIQDYKNAMKMEEGELGKLPPIPLSVLRSGLGYILKQLAGGKFDQGKRDFLEKIVKPKEKPKLDKPGEFKWDYKGLEKLKQKWLDKINLDKNRTLHQDGGRVPLKDGSWKPPLPDENWLESWWKNLGPWEKISVFGFGLKKGGRVDLAGGGLAAALKIIMQKYGKDAIKLLKDVKPSKKWDTQKAIQEFKKRNPEFKAEGGIIGLNAGGPLNTQALIQLYMAEGMTEEEATAAANVSANLPWNILTEKAEGGRVPMWMGGGLGVGKTLLREMLKYFSKGSTHGKSPTEMLKMLNPKQFNEMLNKPGGIPALAKEMIEKYTKTMKKDRADTIGEIITSAKNIKKADDTVIAHKKWMVEDMVKKGSDRKTAEMFADGLSKAMAKTGKDTPKITERGLLELENIHKNLVTKGRPLNAKGGLARMLGE